MLFITRTTMLIFNTIATVNQQTRPKGILKTLDTHPFFLQRKKKGWRRRKQDKKKTCPALQRKSQNRKKKENKK